ncbi:MAG: hypothetical protein OES24_08195, partial [Acidimicrobiia bacterium]|nr:hypothetical protein [Acidimicrobiia bacterium]
DGSVAEGSAEVSAETSLRSVVSVVSVDLGSPLSPAVDVVPSAAVASMINASAPRVPVVDVTGEESASACLDTRSVGSVVDEHCAESITIAVATRPTT